MSTSPHDAQSNSSESGEFPALEGTLVQGLMLNTPLQPEGAVWRAVVEHFPDVVILLNAELQPVYVNRPGGEGFFLPEDAMARHQASSILRQVQQTGQPASYEVKHINTTGQFQYFENQVIALPKLVSEKAVLLVIVKNISDRKSLQQQQKLAAQIFNHAKEGILITDEKANILNVNDAFCQITGYTREEVIGKTPQILRSGYHSPEFYALLWEQLLDKGYWQGEIWNRHKQGQFYIDLLTIQAIYNDRGDVQQYIALFSDITMYKEYQQQIEYLAQYDSLTDLPNRVLLRDRLHAAMGQVDRTHQHLVVVYIDLDGFKTINDRYGHKVGDQVLITIAQRMKQTLRSGDTIARIGGDEFVAVIYPTEAHLWLVILNRLLSAASQPIQLNTLVLEVSASLGVTFYPQTEIADADQLLRQADQAMYQAKLIGKNCYQIYNPDHDRHIRYQYQKRKEIHRGLSHEEFILHYQPKVNMQTGQVLGVEALIRWQHPEKGLLYPGQFLPFIEQDALSWDVGEWVIDTVLSQIETWQEQGYHLPVSINVSGAYLQEENFLPHLETLLALHPNISPDYLELEILETSALKDLKKVSQIMRTCETLGIHFSLDDFGTGYSSLIHLKHLPATHLKIDQSFVRDMLEDPDDLAILEGVLGMANAFRQEVIAEGVETIDHGILLIQLGCKLAQGYAIAPPLPSDALPDWIQTWKPHSLWLNQSSFHFDDFPLLFVKVEHRSWIQSLRNYLSYPVSMPPPWIPPPQRCRFCHWLQEHGHFHYGTQNAFTHLEALHNSIHQKIAKILHNPLSSANPKLIEDLQQDQLNFAHVLNTLSLQCSVNAASIPGQ